MKPLAKTMFEDTIRQAVKGESPFERLRVLDRDSRELLVAEPTDFPAMLEVTDAEGRTRNVHLDAAIETVLASLPQKGIVHLLTEEREIAMEKSGDGIFVESSEREHEQPEGAAPGVQWEKPEYPVRARQAKQLLRALGLATEEGEVKAPLRRKFNQINRLILLLQPLLDRLPKDREVVVLDCGCGKSYLSFLLNYHFRRNLKQQAFFHGIDREPALIAHCDALRETLKYHNMAFQLGDIGDFTLDRPVDLLVSLHACNTATDKALERAVEMGVPFIVVAPCCQQELASQLRPEACPGLFDEGLLKEKMAALMTDALRCLALRSRGYLVRAAEFVPPWDTPKNVLIRAERVGSSHPESAAKFKALCEQFGVRPRIASIVK